MLSYILKDTNTSYYHVITPWTKVPLPGIELFQTFENTQDAYEFLQDTKAEEVEQRLLPNNIVGKSEKDIDVPQMRMFVTFEDQSLAPDSLYLRIPSVIGLVDISAYVKYISTKVGRPIPHSVEVVHDDLHGYRSETSLSGYKYPKVYQIEEFIALYYPKRKKGNTHVD